MYGGSELLLGQSNALLIDDDFACWCEKHAASKKEEQPSRTFTFGSPRRRKRDMVKAFFRRAFLCFEDNEEPASENKEARLWQSGKVALVRPDWETSVNLTYHIE